MKKPIIIEARQLLYDSAIQREICGWCGGKPGPDGGIYIDTALESTPTTFVTQANSIPVSGWSGYNIINTSSFATYGNTPTSQYGRVRFTFRATSGSTTYNGMQLINISGFGGVGWTVPSNMARNGHLYSWDADQNALFPALVRGTTLQSTVATGTAPLSVNSTTVVPNLNASLVNGFTVEKSVPSNAVFTDTVYTHPSTHPASMITQDASNRFVTDAQITAWNAKGTSNLTLGTTSSTAYRGDYGNTAYTHSQSTHAPTDAQANQTLTSGNGMAAWTATSGNLTIVLGTPSSITSSSTNSVTATSHTHLLGDIDCGTF